VARCHTRAVPGPDEGGTLMRRTGVSGSDGDRAHRRPTRLWLVALAVPAIGLSSCSLHVSKNGVNGNIFGHKFSAAQGVLPAGFPSSVPVPDGSRVLVGGGTSGTWDVGFAVKGDLTAGTAAYQDKFRTAGYTVTDVQAGSTPITGATGVPSGSTTTTVTVTGSTFRATDPQWTVEVESGTTTSSTGGTLKPGEFAVNITVVPTSSTTTTSP